MRILGQTWGRDSGKRKAGKDRVRTQLSGGAGLGARSVPASMAGGVPPMVQGAVAVQTPESKAVSWPGVGGPGGRA